MKAIVTGCAGFIGSHLCERLLEEGFEVVGIDSLTDYYDVRLKRLNLKPLTRSPRFAFVRCDLIRVDGKVIGDGEIIFHLAAQPGVRGSWGSSFATYIKNNILVTQRLLELVKESTQLRKLVYASSSSVYGRTSVEKVTEEHPTKPVSPYGVTKLAAEHLCSLYEANYGTPVVSLRLFTVYGPRQRPDMAFSRLAYAALTGRKFTLYGDGSQRRDFTYIGDVVRALLAAGVNPGAKGVFNIGGGHVVSLSDAITIVEEIVGRQVVVEKLATQKGDVPRTGADISRSGKLLGYQPTCKIREGLERQIQYLRGLVESYPCKL